MRRKETGRRGLLPGRWPVLMAPLAAAVATVVVASPPVAAEAAHTRGMSARASLAHQAIAYVFAAGFKSRGTVTPIQTATNTTLKPIKAGTLPIGIAITP